MGRKYYIEVTPFFPTPDCFRGPFVYDQARAIARNSDYEVVVFKPAFMREDVSDYDYGDIRVHRFRTLGLPGNILNGITNEYNCRSFLRKLNEVGIKVDDIAVVHGHTAMFAAYALAVKRLNVGVTAIVQHHDPDPFGLRSGRFVRAGWNVRYKTRKAMRLFRDVDVHVSVSRYVENNLLAFPGCSPHDIEPLYKSLLGQVDKIKPFAPKNSIVLYNGVDTEIFNPNVRQKSKKFTIGCIANFGDWKDQPTLLKAVHEICQSESLKKDLHVVIVGSGTEETEYRDFVEQNGLKDVVEFYGEVDHADIPRIMGRFDLFVLPSFFEGFGCVFTEAAACGIPFITCRHQGATEYLDPAEMERWTISPGDYEDLAHKIVSFKEQRPSQKLVHEYNINLLIREYLGWLKTIMSGGEIDVENII